MRTRRQFDNHSTEASLPRSPRSQPSPIVWRPGFILLLLCWALGVGTLALKAQSATSNNGSNNGMSDAHDSLSAMGVAGTSTNEDDDSSALGSTQAAAKPLTADQIIAILQENSALTAEVKQQLADRMQTQGVQIDANNVTDDMLFAQIRSNPDLQSALSNYLQMRGYTSQTQGSATSTARSTIDGSISKGLPGSSEREQMSDRPVSSSTDGSLLDHMPGSEAERTARTPRTPMTTDVPKVVRQPTPYDLQALHDLYAQLPQDTDHLKRFGSDVFALHRDSAAGRSATTRDATLGVPMGPDYIVGPGDSLTINIWGGVTQTVTRTIDREGRVTVPEAGPIQVAGLPLSGVESLLAQKLEGQYRDAKISVTVSQLRSVRVYVVGEVQRPGGYDVSSLATPLSILYEAGGPTAGGSLRVVKHLRGEKLLEDIDLYDFLLHGIHKNQTKFESGDTLLVPPTGPEVAVFGSVKRAAIYELKPNETSLSDVLQDAGGVTVAASLQHITVDRIVANDRRETLTLPAGEGQSAVTTFAVKDGDRVHVASILPYSERSIYLEGHVLRPGRLSFTDGMKLSNVLHSYRDLLPEPSEHGQVIRLVSPDLHVETLDFSLSDVLVGNTDFPLQPFDTIHIFGRYEVDAPKVEIQGEVQKPGSYPMSQGMTAAQLVRVAGGFKRDALRASADLTSYDVVNGALVKGKLTTVMIGDAVDHHNTDADVPLHPGDILTVHQITGWNDIGQSITIQGQVRYPGTYGFQEGSTLSEVLRRAGGFRDSAYPEGAVLVRQQVRELEEKSRDELIRQIESNAASAKVSPALGAADSGAALQLVKAQQQGILSQLKSQPPTGRQVIHISSDIDSWANTPADVEVRRGDVLTVPKRPGFILVTGQVYNATALTFSPGRTAGWYLRNAGGVNNTADKKEIFIIRANGSLIGHHSGNLFGGSVLSTKLGPGDVVVVPQKIIGGSILLRTLLTTAQIASSVAVTAAIATL